MFGYENIQLTKVDKCGVKGHEQPEVFGGSEILSMLWDSRISPN